MPEMKTIYISASDSMRPYFTAEVSPHIKAHGASLEEAIGKLMLMFGSHVFGVITYSVREDVAITNAMKPYSDGGK